MAYAQRILQSLRNPYAYPAGVGAGVDLTHPAISGNPAFISVACLGSANLTNLWTGQPGTISTGPFNIAASGVGPSITKSSSVATYTSFADPAGANANRFFTAAAIFQLSSLAAINGIICNTTTASSGVRCLVSTTGIIELISQSSLTSAAGVISAGVPYFVIFGSNSSSSAYIYTVNLQTGAFTKTTTAGVGLPTTTSGSILIGNDSGTNTRVAFGIARAMWSYQSLSPTQALQWCYNPWAFWHPSLSIPNGFSQFVGVSSSNLLSLLGYSKASAAGFINITGKVPVVGASEVQLKGVAYTTGTLPLIAKTTTKVKGAAQTNLGAALMALLGSGAAQIKGLASIAGKVPILGKTATQARAAAQTSLGAALLALLGSGAAQVRGKAAIVGNAPLLAKTAIQAKGASQASFGGALQALLALGGIQVKGRAAVTGKLPLSAKTATATHMAAAVSGVTILRALMSKGSVQVRGALGGYKFSVPNIPERTIKVANRIRTLIGKW